MADELNGKRIAFLVANEGIEPVHLTELRKAVEAAGAESDVVAPDARIVEEFAEGVHSGQAEKTSA